MGRAHTLQREGVLSQIVNATNHVLRANTLRHDSGEGSVSTIGWKHASTFLGFCATHDAALFGPIEREQFTGPPQQTFLVGCRALCHEVFAKKSATMSLAKVQDVIDRGRSDEDQRDIQRRMGDHRSGLVRGYGENSWYKEQADAVVKSGDYCKWGGAAFEIAGRLSIASAGSATPSYDLSPKRIQNLRDFSQRVQPIMFGMVPTVDAGGSNFVVFSWPPACPAIDALIASFWERPNGPDRRRVGAVHVGARREHLLCGRMVGFSERPSARRGGSPIRADAFRGREVDSWTTEAGRMAVGQQGGEIPGRGRLTQRLEPAAPRLSRPCRGSARNG